MIPTIVKRHVGELPYMTLQHGWAFYKLITYYRLHKCLELGFFHGVSSNYIAGALEDLGGLSLLTTIDLECARDREPNIETLLAKTGLSKYVTPYYEERSFNWRMMRFLQDGMENCFDFCYIDGGHTWDVTGFATCLATRLLKSGGWLVFDDLDYTFAKSRLAPTKWVQALPHEERTEPQVQIVFDLLVRNSPHYINVCRFGRFGSAQKVSLSSNDGRPRSMSYDNNLEMLDEIVGPHLGPIKSF